MFVRTSQLLFLATAVFVRRVTAEANQIGIAFSGGGFKSVSDQTALTAGLLAVLMKRDPTLIEDSSPLANSGLYKDVSSLSTISGGSWFTSYLVYSKVYRIMVEKMAKQCVSGQEKGTVRKTFYVDYGKRFDALTQAIMATPDPKKSSIDIANLEDQVATIAGVKLFAAYAKLSTEDGSQFSWYSLTEFLLGPDISEATLGSEVQDWCKGKSWNIISTGVTPSGPLRNYLWVNWPDSNKQLSYNVVRAEWAFEFVPLLVPVIFSTVLGYPAAATPLPEINDMSKKIQIKHYGDVKKSFFDPLGIGSKVSSFFRPPVSAKGMQPMTNSQNSFADMPIVGPVAASSAAVGFASLLGEKATALLCEGLNANPAVGFACKKQPSESFSYGQGLLDKIWNSKELSKTDYNDVVQEGVYNLIDGGATDPFGIATALASGAREVFCVNAIDEIAKVDVHFTSPLNRIGPLKPLDLFQPLDEKIASDRDTVELELNSAGSVKKVQFETIKVKTVKNDFFGIEAGREVTLHVFSALHKDLETFDMVSGNVESFGELGEYIEDIMMILSSDDNKVTVDKMLNALKNSQ